VFIAVKTCLTAFRKAEMRTPLSKFPYVQRSNNKLWNKYESNPL